MYEMKAFLEDFLGLVKSIVIFLRTKEKSLDKSFWTGFWTLNIITIIAPRGWLKQYLYSQFIN